MLQKNYIEKFIQEFFITNRSDNGIFRLNNSDKKYKYVNYSAINIINSCQISSVDNIDDIFKDFNEKLKENYVEEKVDEKKSNNDSETKDLDKLFELKNKSLYIDIFDDFSSSDNPIGLLLLVIYTKFIFMSLSF